MLTYNDAYVLRAESKMLIKDYFGAIKDIQQFHFLSKDSTAFSCYIYANSAQNTGKNKIATKYYNAAIKKNDDISKEGLILCYEHRGVLLFNDGLKEKGCLDWSSALELGSENALKYITDYCNK